MLNVVFRVMMRIMHHLVGGNLTKTTLCYILVLINRTKLNTFGFDILKMTKAPVKTKDNSPRVKAFQVLSAIKAKASGTKTAVLNFKPNKNGTIIFFTALDRPKI